MTPGREYKQSKRRNKMKLYDKKINFCCELCGMEEEMHIYKFKKYSCSCLKGANNPQKRKNIITINEVEND